jgi:hypothetical protein
VVAWLRGMNAAANPSTFTSVSKSTQIRSTQD